MVFILPALQTAAQLIIKKLLAVGEGGAEGYLGAVLL